MKKTTPKRTKGRSAGQVKHLRAQGLLKYDRRDQITEITGNLLIVFNSMPNHYPDITLMDLLYLCYIEGMIKRQGYFTALQLSKDFNLHPRTPKKTFIDKFIQAQYIEKISRGKYILSSLGINYLNTFNRIMINLLNTGLRVYSLYNMKR